MSNDIRAGGGTIDHMPLEVFIKVQQNDKTIFNTGFDVEKVL